MCIVICIAVRVLLKIDKRCADSIINAQYKLYACSYRLGTILRQSRDDHVYCRRIVKEQYKLYARSYRLGISEILHIPHISVMMFNFLYKYGYH